MPRIRWVEFLAGAAAVVPVAAAIAHHSVRSNFDMNSTIVLDGTISAVNIRNPHSQYVLDVAGDDGAVTEWFIEWSDRNALIRRKVNVDKIKVGDRVTVTAWPSRRLDRVAYFVQAVLPDGSTFRDCGFREFREAVVNSTEFQCEEGQAE